MREGNNWLPQYANRTDSVSAGMLTMGRVEIGPTKKLSMLGSATNDFVFRSKILPLMLPILLWVS